MSDPIDPTPISPHQRPIDPQAKVPAAPLTPSQGGWDSIDELFGTELSPKEKEQFQNNMLKMVQVEIQRMQKRMKEATQHMRDVIEGRY
jgi:hypothetical protein